MRTIKETTYKGTRILVGDRKRELISLMIEWAIDFGCVEIQIPIIQHQETFKDKVGDNNNLMFNFQDRGGRNLCLAPEYTAVCQQLAKTTFKQDRDVKLFYVAECFRGEKPQKGRYRQFTQFGVEWLNPTRDVYKELIAISERMLAESDLMSFTTVQNIPRGLDYYTSTGFEITSDGLAICGGGEYGGGVGFAIGVDRILAIENETNKS